MRVILADDHRLLLEGLANLLVAHGVEVVATASDGFEAVIRTRVHRPDVVLMDVRMPGCDGLAATRLIKAELPETRVPKLHSLRPRESEMLELYESALGALRSSPGSDVLPVFERIHGALAQRFEHDWLLRWNLLESLQKLGLKGPGRRTASGKRVATGRKARATTPRHANRCTWRRRP